MQAQELEGIGKQKSFSIRGNIGASASFYSSNEATATRPPWAWNLYGNFSPEVYGISLPVSFVVNQYGNSFSQPFAQFGLSPTYKWAKLHLGYRTIRMSPLVFEGQSFRGAGVELNPGVLRFAAFYGKLNRKVNEDTTSGRYTTPQFSRTGYGLKLGVGNQSHYLDFIFFYAKDDTSSAIIINKERLQPNENAVVGTSFKTTLLKRVSFMGDLAVSGLTDDLTAPKEDSSQHNFSEKILSVLMPFNSSTSVRFGGQAAITAQLKNYNTTIGYRRIEPGFKSLGTPYMVNDIELLNWVNHVNLLEGKLNINTDISNQHNNLNKALTSELNTFVSGLNISATPVSPLNLNLNYSGYLMKQKDGTAVLDDSVRLDQQVHQIGFMPSYTVMSNVISHTFSGSLSYMLLKDNNSLTQPYTASQNLAASINYNLGLTQTGISLSAGTLFNEYAQDTNRYTTYGINLGAAGQFLKKKNLSTQLTAGYMLNESNIANAQSNITFSVNAGYRHENHSLSLNANYVYTPYNPINEVIERALSRVVASKNFMAGLTYNYAF